ncbi:1-aminocyclopropane-1-carboxylate oxidase like protein 7 [Quercus suber]|uniref:1-aminocyclopropane-1-carboxylate oxidase like protein 7 n=1 Tax=Quercus suber TaxID=58331 RepID=A0AAW0LLB1_QUESU
MKLQIRAVKRLGLTLLEFYPSGWAQLIILRWAVLQDTPLSVLLPACPEPNEQWDQSTQMISSLFFYKTKLEAYNPLPKSLISNDKFISATHRVLANQVGPRISVACFFSNHIQKQMQPINRLYGPIKELLSDDNPPLYRETSEKEYAFKGFGNSVLDHFRL